jgi:phenylalanine-4-hydroxylase
MNVVACSKGGSSFSKIIPFDMEKVVLTRFDYSDIQDRYFSIKSLKELFIEFENDKELFFFEG